MFKKFVMTTIFACGCGKKNSGGSGGSGVTVGAPKRSSRTGEESPGRTGTTLNNQLSGRTDTTPSNLSVLRSSDQNDSSGRPGEGQLPAHGSPVLHSHPSKRQRNLFTAEKDGLLTGSPARTAGQESRRDLRPLSISHGRPPVVPPLPTVRTPEVYSSPREVKRSSPPRGHDYLPDWPFGKRAGPPSGFTPFFPRTGEEAPSHLWVSDLERAANERNALEEKKKKQEKERQEAEARERANLTRRRAVEDAAKKKKADELKKEQENEEARQRISRAAEEGRKKQLANAAAEEANRLKERQQIEAKRSFRLTEQQKPLLAESRETEIKKAMGRDEEKMAKIISDYKASVAGLDSKYTEGVLKVMEGFQADMKSKPAEIQRNPFTKERKGENALINGTFQRPNVVNRPHAGINPALQRKAAAPAYAYP